MELTVLQGRDETVPDFKELKRKVIEKYIKGEGSSIDLEIKYDISSGLLRSQIRMYYANRKRKDYAPK